MSSDSDPPPPSPSGSGPAAGPRPMTALMATGWAFGATFVFVILVATALVGRPDAKVDVVRAVVCQAAAYLLALFLILRVHAPDAGIRDFVGMRPTHWIFALLGLGLGLSLQFPAEVLVDVVKHFWPGKREGLISAAFFAASPAQRAAIALAGILVGPMLEEVLFRGALFRPMLKVRRPVVVIVVTAALFALAHGAPRLLPAFFFLGLVVGYLRWASGSLVPGMVLHTTFNAIPFYVMVAQGPAAFEEDTPTPRAVLAAMSAAALLLIALVGVVGARSSSARVAREFDRE